MHPVIFVTGASGGLGTSTLTAVTGTVLGPGRSVTLVDADFRGGGLDATLAVEHLDGLRWGDLGEHDGEVDARGLREQLPHGPVPVLAARGAPPDTRTAAAVIQGLSRLGPVVVDAPSGTGLPDACVAAVDLVVVVVVVGLRPRWLRDGERLAAGLGDLTDRTLLVTRGPRRAERAAGRAADHLGLVLLDHLADDPGVLRDEARGAAPRVRGAVGEVARGLVEALPSAVTAPEPSVPELAS